MPSREHYVPAAVLAAIGAAFIGLSLGYPLFDVRSSIGPGVLPLICGGLLVLFAGLIARDLWRARHDETIDDEIAIPDPAPQGTEDIAPVAAPSRIPEVPLILGLLLVTLVLVGFVGFIPAFSLLVLILLAVVERERWWRSLFIGCGIGLAVWLVFDVLIGVQLPAGSLSLF